MYYLVLINLGVKRCIDISENDKYADGQTYNCQQSLEFENNKKEVREVRIRCIEDSRRKFFATVYRD